MFERELRAVDINSKDAYLDGVRNSGLYVCFFGAPHGARAARGNSSRRILDFPFSPRYFESIKPTGRFLRDEAIMKSRLIATLFAGALVIAGVGVGAAPANAAADACDSGAFCLWYGADFPGVPSGGEYQSSTSVYVVTANDTASSIYNRGNSCNIRYYEDVNYGGRNEGLTRGSLVSDLRSVLLPFPGVGQTWNDRISSHKFVC